MRGFLRWLLGLDAVTYWEGRSRKHAELTTELQAELRRKERAHSQRLADGYKENQRLLEVMRGVDRRNKSLSQEIASLRRTLMLEQTARGLYEQVLTEAGEQIEKNKTVAPATTLGVLKAVFAEALATVIEWRETGVTDPAEVINTRAKLANAMLPEPDRSKDRPGIRTERKRDGRVGDTTVEANPLRLHYFDYGLTEAATLTGVCQLKGCGKAIGDPIHKIGPGWKAEVMT